MVLPRGDARWVLRPLPTRALRGHAGTQHSADPRPRRPKVYLLLRAVSVDLQTRTGALLRSQGRGQAYPGRRGAGQPHRDRAEILRADPLRVGEGCAWRGVSLVGRTGHGSGQAVWEGAQLMLVPLYGFLKGDTLGLIVLV